MAFGVITYLAGNGFDKSLKLKTSYSEFYEFYTRQPSKSENIAKLKRDISNKTDLWSDLEKQLGKYTVQIKDQKHLEEVIFDVSNSLKEYLSIEESKLIVGQDNKTYFQSLQDPTSDMQSKNEGLCFDCLLDPNSSPTMWNGSLFSDVRVNIISFNYTTTLDKILDYGNNKNDKLNILHIHGKLSEDIILGVDNLGQISNKELVSNDDCKNIIVKPAYNSALENDRVDDAHYMIDNANVIIISGMSLGVTDESWWTYIGKWLTLDKNHCLIIDWFIPNYSQQRDIIKTRDKDVVKNKFINVANLKDTAIKKRIIVRLCHPPLDIKSDIQ